MKKIHILLTVLIISIVMLLIIKKSRVTLAGSCELFPISSYNITLSLRYGFIDNRGSISIKPIYKYANCFYEGLAAIQKDNKWGFIDKLGNEIIIPKYDDVGDFSEGYAFIMIGDPEIAPLYGFIDKIGNVVVEPKFMGALNFSEGLAGVSIDSKWGYIDSAGKMIIDTQFDEVKGFTDGLACVRENKLFGYINKFGEYIITPQFQYAEPFAEGIALVKIIEGKVVQSYYLDKSGNKVNISGFTDGKRFSESMAAVKVDNYWGYINKEACLIIKPQFINAKDFSDGLAAVQFVEDGSKWGYINKYGEVVIIPSFEEADNFIDGMAKVKINNRTAYIDKEGNIKWKESILPTIYFR